MGQITAHIICKWLAVRGDGPIDEHFIASLAEHDPGVAEAWEHWLLIDELISSASLVKRGLASESFASVFRQRLAEGVDGPEAEQAIWDAA
jgi:hypothetical protein